MGHPTDGGDFECRPAAAVIHGHVRLVQTEARSFMLRLRKGLARLAGEGRAKCSIRMGARRDLTCRSADRRRLEAAAGRTGHVAPAVEISDLRSLQMRQTRRRRGDMSRRNVGGNVVRPPFGVSVKPRQLIAEGALRKCSPLDGSLLGRRNAGPMAVIVDKPSNRGASAARSTGPGQRARR